MFGGAKAKIGGLRHIYVYYLGKPPKPEDIKLYESFNKPAMPALTCGGAIVEENVVHTSDPALMASIKSNQTSCVSIGCHQTVHDVATLKDQKLWNGSH